MNCGGRVHGYHVCNDIWEAGIPYEREPSNTMDRYAIAIKMKNKGWTSTQQNLPPMFDLSEKRKHCFWGCKVMYNYAVTLTCTCFVNKFWYLIFMVFTCKYYTIKISMAIQLCFVFCSLNPPDVTPVTSTSHYHEQSEF